MYYYSYVGILIIADEYSYIWQGIIWWLLFFDMGLFHFFDFFIDYTVKYEFIYDSFDFSHYFGKFRHYTISFIEDSI